MNRKDRPYWMQPYNNILLQPTRLYAAPFQQKQDIEIAAFCRHFVWANRTTIINKANELAAF